jgi:hypothetical protein
LTEELDIIDFEKLEKYLVQDLLFKKIRSKIRAIYV